MSKRTHPRGETPGKPSRWRGHPERSADLEAPTAPHAEPRTGEANKEKLSGPARFWSTRRARVALVIASFLSLLVHWMVAPWELLPSSAGVTFKDPEGDLAIPVDLLGEEPPPPPPEPPPPAPVAPDPTPNPLDDPNAPGKRDAGPPKIKDAGITLSTNADGGDEGADGGAPSDAGEASDAAISDASIDDSGFYSVSIDGGVPGANGPRDPEAMFGLTKVVNAGVQNVVLGVNIALIRTHPVGSRIGPILQAIPQWKDFLKGSQSAVEPVRDTDWILVYGPSLRNTDKDAVLVQYNTSDKAVDQTIAGIAKGYDKGGDFDAGVPGVKGSLGFADNGQRVFLRPQSKLLVIVPPSHAHEAALTFRKQTPRGPPKNEAVRLVMKNPGNEIKVRALKFASSVSEIRLWIIPRDDGGADVYFEGDCTDDAAANDASDQLTQLVRSQNSLGVRIATRGLLNSVKVVPEGKKITLHLLATQEQLEAILQLLGASLNVTIAPPPPPTTAPSGSASRPNFPPPRE